MTTSSSGGPERRILDAIRQIIRAVDMDSRQLASRHDITAPQLMCLMAILEHAPTTAIQVARRVHLSASTLVGVLDRLEAKGLIRRERSDQDRREVALDVTPAGRRFVARTPFPLQYTLDRAMAQLSPLQREELAGWVERLVKLMGADELDAGPMFEIAAISRRHEA